MREAVIVSPTPTPLGKTGRGAFNDMPPQAPDRNGMAAADLFEAL